MKDESTTPTASNPTWEESHPWLSKLTVQDEEDSIDEAIRYALDELRIT